MKSVAFMSALLVAGLAVGCGKKNDNDKKKAGPAAGETAPAKEAAKPEPPAPPAKAETLVAKLAPASDSKVEGTVTFTQKDGKVEIVADVSGLTPGEHGFHIHEKGDCSSPDAKSAGGHFNPTSMDHGSPESEPHHAGDLGNLTADENGHATKTMTSTEITLGEGANSVAGRAVIVHAKRDDLKSQPTGAAGARVACGVIGPAQ